MNRTSLFAAGCLGAALLAGVPAMGQAAGAPAAVVAAPDFDVSTVKTNNTGLNSIHVSIDDDVLRATNVMIDMLMEQAYDIRRDQIVGLPHWATVNHYDITAKVVDMSAEQRKGLTREQRQAMMQKLLVERFGVKTHVETRTLPLMELVVAKDGIKFSEFKKPAEGEKDTGGSMNTHNGDMTATGVEIQALANFLAGQTHMPVLDKTGLKGLYNFHLKWQREEEGAQSGLHDETLPTIYSALTEQLGLKLASAKGPVDVLVVDHIDVPEEN